MNASHTLKRLKKNKLITKDEYCYTGFILRFFLDNLNFDFYSNGEHIFEKRKLFYNDLIREIANKEYLTDSFIAGDYFIKNKDSLDQQIDVFIYCSKFAYSPNIDEILETLNEKYRNKVEWDKNSIYLGVFATFYLNKIILSSYKSDFVNEVTVKNIRIHVCYKKCKDLMKYFTFHPSKIGFIYNNAHLITSNWFVVGGELGDCRVDNVLEKFKQINLNDSSIVSSKKYLVYF
jgi:hypothetical protein